MGGETAVKLVRVQLRYSGTLGMVETSVVSNCQCLILRVKVPVLARISNIVEVAHAVFLGGCKQCF